MIIEMFLNLLYTIFSFLTSPINIPSLPENIYETVGYFMNSIRTGVTILQNYLDYTYLVILLGIIIVVDVGLALYHFVMWVLRKIPLASVS